MVHKTNCPNAVNLRANYDYRIQKAKWIDSSNHFITKISINGIDEIGLVNKISNIISSHLQINIKSFNLNTDNGMFDGKITLEVKNKTQLDKLIFKLKGIEGIKEIKRD